MKIKTNKILKSIWKTIKIVIGTILAIIITIIMIQRISNNNKSLLGYRLFTVATGSMEPKYNVGDMILVKEIEPKDIKLHDDVTYKSNDPELNNMFITHQVIEIKENNGKYSFLTQGIANTGVDPEITEDQIYGTVASKLKVLSFISKKINSNLGFFLIIVVPIAVLIFLEIIDIKEKEKVLKMKTEKNKLRQKIKKSLRFRIIILLGILLIFNTFAWFVYSTTIKTNITATVKSWKIAFNTEDEVFQTVDFILDDLYPGMDDQNKTIEIQNYGDVQAIVSYNIKEVRILEDLYTSSDYTSDELLAIIADNPFTISFGFDKNVLNPYSSGTADKIIFHLEATWDYESGDDEADTAWGHAAYAFKEDNPDTEEIYIGIELVAKQAEEEDDD